MDIEYPIKVDDELKELIERSKAYHVTIKRLSEEAYREEREFWKKATEKYGLPTNKNHRYNHMKGTIEPVEDC